MLFYIYPYATFVYLLISENIQHLQCTENKIYYLLLKKKSILYK